MIENLDTFQGLDVTLNTTQQCNLRCKYCYEDKTKGELSLENAKKFIDLLLTDDDPAYVNVGGTYGAFDFHRPVFIDQIVDFQ